MATVERPPLTGYDGFRVESDRGLLGWVEETWLAENEQPTAFAVRLVDGRRALILTRDVGTVVPERERVAVRDGARLLELGVPHLDRLAADGGARRLAATWRTTGELLEPTNPAGLLRRALLALRPWRLSPPPAPGGERSVGRALLMLLPLLAALIAFEIALAFTAAYLVNGHPY